MKTLPYLFILFFSLACSKSEDPEDIVVEDPPVITINKPTDGQTIYRGQPEIVDASIQVADGRILQTLKFEISVAGLPIDAPTFSNSDFGQPVNGLYTFKDNVEVPDIPFAVGPVDLTLTATDDKGKSDTKKIKLIVN